MKPNSHNDLDELIDAALRSESERDVPFAFHRRTEDRLRIAAMLQHEVGQFRASCVSASVFASLLALGAGLAWFVIDVPDLVARAVPGVLGFYDQFVLLLIGHWPALGGTSIVLIFLVGAAHVAVERSRLTRNPHMDET